jgi:hypothetical protein
MLTNTRLGSNLSMVSSRTILLVLRIQVQLIKFSLVIGVGKELGYFHKVELLLLLISLIIFGLVF